MKEQRQEYQRPVVEVLVVESNDIICSSTAAAPDPENATNITGSSIGSIGDSGTEY